MHQFQCNSVSLAITFNRTPRRAIQLIFNSFPTCCKTCRIVSYTAFVSELLLVTRTLPSTCGVRCEVRCGKSYITRDTHRTFCNRRSVYHRCDYHANSKFENFEFKKWRDSPRFLLSNPEIEMSNLLPFPSAIEQFLHTNSS